MKSYYITTPIYYVNDAPHIGHAYTTIACDVMARFQKLSGKDVFFLTGTDEHGQKIDKAAKNKAIEPKIFTDQVSKTFKRLVNTKNSDESEQNILNISNNDFIRTTEERHIKSAQKLWDKIKENGHIYLDKYSGWYSVRDEAYYAESELVENDGQKVAPTGAEVQWIEEESYFFNLSEWQERLLEFYEDNPDFITPKSRYNEVVSFVRGGKEFEKGALKDLSISRTTFDWGVPVPNDDKHVMYVWLDALTNYLTALGYGEDYSNELEKFWSGGHDSPVHIVGKDILRFHAVYWPAFLMAAKMPLPKKIVAHGWWTIEGKKMSKSLGNVISPDELIEEFGLDQTRFFLMKEVPFGSDGNFSKDSIYSRINSDLANNIGNLVQRTLSMIQKNCDGKVPNPEKFKDEDIDLFEISVDKTFNNYKNNFENFRFDLAINDIVNLSSLANEYIDNQKPWALKKQDTERMNTVLYVLAETIRNIAIMLQPIVPDSAQKILLQLGYDTNMPKDVLFSEISQEHRLKPENNLPNPEGIFPRM